MMDKDNAVKVIEKLAEICKDGEKGYKDAGDKSILESVEKGEDEAKEAYQEAIRASLPSDVAEIVSRQARSVQTAHDRVKSLRDGLAA